MVKAWDTVLIFTAALVRHGLIPGVVQLHLNGFQRYLRASSRAAPLADAGGET